MYRGASEHCRRSVCVCFVAVVALRPARVFSSPLTAHHKSGLRHLEVEWPDLVSTFLAFRHLEVEWSDLVVVVKHQLYGSSQSMVTTGTRAAIVASVIIRWVENFPCM